MKRNTIGKNYTLIYLSNHIKHTNYTYSYLARTLTPLVLVNIRLVFHCFLFFVVRTLGVHLYGTKENRLYEITK